MQFSFLIRMKRGCVRKFQFILFFIFLKVAAVNKIPKPKPKVEKPKENETNTDEENSNNSNSTSENPANDKPTADSSDKSTDKEKANTEAEVHDELWLQLNEHIKINVD